MLLAKRDQLAHLLVLPVGEGTYDVRSLNIVDLPRHEPERILIVLLDVLIFDLGQLRYPWRPYEQSEDVLPTEPTLTVLIGTYLPFAGVRHDLLVAEVTLDDELLGTAIVQILILLIDSLGLDDVAQLEALADVFPELFGIG